MIENGHFTITQAKNEIFKLENELDLYLTKKKINFEKTQPGAISMKDIIVSSNSIFDKFTHYVIKNEELDSKIYQIQEAINSYQRFIINEMKRMSKYDEIGLICYLREEENKPWKDIDKMLHRSKDYSKVKYARYKQKRLIDND